MHGLEVYVKEVLPFAHDLSLENSADSYVFDWLYLLIVLLLFPLSITFFLLVYGLDSINLT